MNEHQVSNVSPIRLKAEAYQSICDSTWTKLLTEAKTEGSKVEEAILARQRKIKSVIRYNVQKLLAFQPGDMKSFGVSNTSRRSSTRDRVSVTRYMDPSQGNSARGEELMSTPGEEKNRKFCDYVETVMDIALKKHGLRAFDPLSNEEGNAVKRFLKSEIGHTYLPTHRNHDFCKPVLWNAKGIEKQAYREGLCTGETNNVYNAVLDQLAEGLLPPVCVKDTPSCGFGLFAAKKIKAGTVLMEYNGTLQFNHCCPIFPADGFDKVLTLIEHKVNPAFDICVNPEKSGSGLAHLAFTASPANNDYQFCNMFLIPKLLERSDPLTDPTPENPTPTVKEVHLFLITTRDIQEGEPLVWFYGYPYFNMIKLHMKDETPTWLTVKQIFRENNIPVTWAAKNDTKAPAKRGRPRKKVVNNTMQTPVKKRKTMGDTYDE